MLYKTINLPNRDKIVKELENNFPVYFGKITEDKSKFYGCNVKLVKQVCPLLGDFLRGTNLYNRWLGGGISIISSSTMPIHTDSDRPLRNYALNIPIFNCQDSYTVWYEPIDATKFERKEYVSNDVTVISNHYSKDNVVELGRVCSDSVAFVNIKTPHHGINHSSNLRALISLRFVPELTLEEIENFDSVGI